MENNHDVVIISEAKGIVLGLFLRQNEIIMQSVVSEYLESGYNRNCHFQIIECKDEILAKDLFEAIIGKGKFRVVDPTSFDTFGLIDFDLEE